MLCCNSALMLLLWQQKVLLCMCVSTCVMALGAMAAMHCLSM